MHSSAIPRVSIGVPVYNGSALLRQVLDSLRFQSFSDIEILISDNCSTDSTEAICREYANIDFRISYFRQPQNIGSCANFHCVLAQARAEYFMWKAADDARSPDFVEINLRFLERHSEYTGSTSPTQFVGGEFDPIQMGDASPEGTPGQNFISFFNAWRANGRFYSLIRWTAWARCERTQRSFLGSDWAVILECCMQGKFHRADESWTLIGKSGVSQSTRILSVFRNHWHERIIPFLELSKAAWSLSFRFTYKGEAGADSCTPEPARGMGIASFGVACSNARGALDC